MRGPGGGAEGEVRLAGEVLTEGDGTPRRRTEGQVLRAVDIAADELERKRYAGMYIDLHLMSDLETNSLTARFLDPRAKGGNPFFFPKQVKWLMKRAEDSSEITVGKIRLLDLAQRLHGELDDFPTR